MDYRYDLGGMESPNGDASAMRYADFVLNGLLRSELLARFAGRATVLGGAGSSII
jgi:hypothetical protein